MYHGVENNVVTLTLLLPIPSDLNFPTPCINHSITIARKAFLSCQVTTFSCKKPSNDASVSAAFFTLPLLPCNVFLSFFLSSSYLSRKSQPVWWSVPAAGAGLQPLEPGGLGVPSWGDWDRGSSRSHCMSEPSCWRICLSHMCNVSLPVAQRLKLSDFPGLLQPKPFYDSLIRCQWNRKVWMEIQVFHMVADSKSITETWLSAWALQLIKEYNSTT